MQTYSGKVVAFSEEEVGSFQPSSAPASPLKRLTTQFSKVHESLPPAVSEPPVTQHTLLPLCSVHFIATLINTLYLHVLLLTALKMSIVIAAYTDTAVFMA